MVKERNTRKSSKVREWVIERIGNTLYTEDICYMLADKLEQSGSQRITGRAINEKTGMKVDILIEEHREKRRIGF